jgi:hypothetical protein
MNRWTTIAVSETRDLISRASTVDRSPGLAAPDAPTPLASFLLRLRLAQRKVERQPGLRVHARHRGHARRELQVEPLRELRVSNRVVRAPQRVELLASPVHQHHVDVARERREISARVAHRGRPALVQRRRAPARAARVLEPEPHDLPRIALLRVRRRPLVHVDCLAADLLV